MDFARRVKRSFLAGRSLDAESRRTLSAGRGRAVDVRAPSRVARFFVQKSFGCFDGAEERGLRRADEKGGDVVGRRGNIGGQGRPVAEIGGSEEGGGELGGGDAAEGLAEALIMPGVAAGIGDDGGRGRPDGVGDEIEAAVSKGGARAQGLPGAESHRDGADAEGRAGAFAEDEGAHLGEVDAEAINAAEDRDAGFSGLGFPASGAVGGEQADLAAQRGRVQKQDGGVVADELGQTRHRGHQTHPAGAGQARNRRTRGAAESGIDRTGASRRLPDSFNENLSATFLPVNIQLNNVSDTRKSIVVTLDKSEVDAEYQATVSEFSKFAQLPGFRPGKAPANLVLKRYGKDILGEFKQKVVAKAYRSALDEKKLEVLNLVNVEEGTIEPGLSAAVTVTVDVQPEFALPDYVGLPTEIAGTEATDAEVDTVIEGLRGERADFKVAERPAQKSDYVKLSYEGTVDGKAITELAPEKQIYGKVPQTWEEVEGANDGVLPGLGKALAGVKTGDKKDITITFPADFAPVAALAGKVATYAVEILEIRERVLPELNEEFFKSQQVDNLDALKSSVRNNLKLRKEYENQTAQRRQVTEAIAAKVDFPVPQSLVDSETQGVLRQFIEENMRRGVPQDQFEKDKKELFAGAQKAATQRVKVQLILAKIATAEKISVSERDIDNFIYREASRSGQKPEKLVKDLTKDRDQLRAIQQNIIFDKAVDFLVSKATVTTTPAKA